MNLGSITVKYDTSAPCDETEQKKSSANTCFLKLRYPTGPTGALVQKNPSRLHELLPANQKSEILICHIYIF